MEEVDGLWDSPPMDMPAIDVSQTHGHARSPNIVPISEKDPKLVREREDEYEQIASRPITKVQAIKLQDILRELEAIPKEDLDDPLLGDIGEFARQHNIGVEAVKLLAK